MYLLGSYTPIYSVAQMCTREDTLAHILGTLYIDDVMSYNLLTTKHYSNNGLEVCFT